MGNTKAEPYPFAERERIYRRQTDAALAWARNDAYEAMKCSEGWNAPAACWYADDLHTIAKEMQRRADKCKTRA